jgi:hypothetical protein
VEEFDLLPREEKVRIGGAVYTIREMSEAGSIEERRQMSRGITLDEQGRPSAIPLDALPENEAFVVSRCLFDSSNTPVALETIKEWPRRVVRSLFDKCQKLNDIKKDEPKNSPSAGTGTSA